MFLFKWIQSFFNIRKINSKSSQRCLFYSSQVVFVFPALPPFFFKDLDFLIKYPFYSCEVSSFFSVNVLTRWFSWRCSTSSSFFILFISGGFKSSFVDHIFSSFQCLLMPVHLLIFPACHSIVPECWRYLEDSCFPLYIRSSSFEDVISFMPFNLTGAISLFKQSFIGVSFQWALTHRSFFQDLTWLF